MPSAAENSLSSPFRAAPAKSLVRLPSTVDSSTMPSNFSGRYALTEPFTDFARTGPSAPSVVILTSTSPLTVSASTGPTDVATLIVPFIVRAITGAVAATPIEPFMVNASTFTPVGT